MRPTISNSKGFTIIELAVALFIISILVAVAVLSMTGSSEQARFDETVFKMENIKKAITGDPALVSGGSRTSFGYYGDWGAFPAAIGDLINQGAQVNYVFDASRAAGAGWRGPYLPSGFFQTASITDGWGNPITMTASGTGVVLTSLGGDNAVGGTGTNADITLGIPVNEVKGTLRVGVFSQGTAINNAAVSLFYPDGTGMLGNPNQTSNVGTNGFYTFNNVPYTVVGIRVVHAVTNTNVTFPFSFSQNTSLVRYEASAAAGGGGGGGGGGNVNANANAINNLPASGNNGVNNGNPTQGPTIGPVNNPPWNPGGALGNPTRAYVLLTNNSGANITIRSINVTSPNFGKLKVSFYKWNTGAKTTVANNINPPYGTFNNIPYTISSVAPNNQVLLELDFQNNISLGSTIGVTLWTGVNGTGTNYQYNLQF